MDRLFLLTGAVEFWVDSQAKLKSGKDGKSEFSDPKYGKVTLQTSMRMFIEGQTASMKEFYLSTMSTLNEKGGNILGKRRHREGLSSVEKDNGQQNRADKIDQNPIGAQGAAAD